MSLCAFDHLLNAEFKFLDVNLLTGEVVLLVSVRLLEQGISLSHLAKVNNHFLDYISVYRPQVLA